jgi:hypothetical protein
MEVIFGIIEVLAVNTFLGWVYIVLPQIIIDFLLGHLVEAEVVENVSEVVKGNVACAILIIKVEGVLQI